MATTEMLPDAPQAEQIKPKRIFLACFPATGWGKGDVIGSALCEDGTGLASHLSSSKEFAKHDMGLTSNWKHEGYAEHTGGAYELEWVDDPATHPGWQAALALNRQRESQDV